MILDVTKTIHRIIVITTTITIVVLIFFLIGVYFTFNCEAVFSMSYSVSAFPHMVSNTYPIASGFNPDLVKLSCIKLLLGNSDYLFLL